MKKSITPAEQFCHDILNLGIKYAKPLVGIVLFLASETSA